MKPPFENPLEKFDALWVTDQRGVPFNTLTCVHRFNGRKPSDVYRLLRQELDSTYIQFIPFVELKGFERTAPKAWNSAALPRDGDPQARPGHPNSIVTNWSVDPDDWGYFLSRVFDRWLKQDIGKVMVNHIETLVAQHLGLPSQMCVYSEDCGRAVAAENDGSIYSCDHFVYPDYRLGNLKNGQLGDMVFSGRQAGFGHAKSATLPRYCRECPYLTDCWGGMPQEPHHPYDRRRAGIELPVPGIQKILRTRPARSRTHRGAAAPEPGPPPPAHVGPFKAKRNARRCPPERLRTRMASQPVLMETSHHFLVVWNGP